MSKLKSCKCCDEVIKWDDDVFIGLYGDVYHERCVSAAPSSYVLFNSQGDWIDESECTDLACCALHVGQYLDTED